MGALRPNRNIIWAFEHPPKLFAKSQNEYFVIIIFIFLGFGGSPAERSAGANYKHSVGGRRLCHQRLDHFRTAPQQRTRPARGFFGWLTSSQPNFHSG